MTQIALFVIPAVVLALVVGRFLWTYAFLREVAAGRLGPSLVAQMDAFLEPVEGTHPSGDDLARLEQAAHARFVEILAAQGVVLRGWRVVLRDDEILGPRCAVSSDSGDEILLGDFERRVRAGELDFDATRRSVAADGASRDR